MELTVLECDATSVPIFAAAAMTLSPVKVVSNALRSRRFRPVRVGGEPSAPSGRRLALADT